MTPVDDLVTDLRAELGMQDRFPGSEDHWRLARLLERRGRIVLQWTDRGPAHSRTLPDGRRLIVLVAGRPDEETEGALLEEIGHALTMEAEGFVLCSDALMRTHEHRDESLARLFVESWLLPWCVIEDGETRYRRLMQSGYDLPQINERLERLGVGAMELD